MGCYSPRGFDTILCLPPIWTSLGLVSHILLSRSLNDLVASISCLLVSRYYTSCIWLFEQGNNKTQTNLILLVRSILPNPCLCHQLTLTPKALSGKDRVCYQPHHAGTDLPALYCPPSGVAWFFCCQRADWRKSVSFYNKVTWISTPRLNWLAKCSAL